MESMRPLTALLTLLMIVSSCATMNEQECLVSDWAAVGYEDGAQGVTSTYFGEYRRACAKHGIAPNFQAWQAGRSDGLVEYCQPTRGFYLGESGRRYNGVCEAALEPAFLDAYSIGSQLYSLRAHVNSINSNINNNTATMERIDARMVESTVLIASDDTPSERRILLLAELAEMSEEKGRLEEEMTFLVKERARAEIELDNYSRSIAAYGY